MLLIRIYHDTDNSVDNVVANASYLMVITASLHSALISHDNYHISFAFWIRLTLPEYDQNPVVFAANLEEVVIDDNPDTVDNHIALIKLKHFLI